MSEPIYLLDGHSQIYRAYYAPFRDLTSPTGEPTRATYVFCSMLLKLIRDKRPAYLAMAVDGPAEALLRRRDYPDYKVTRKPAPDDFRPQVARILQIVRALGIPILESPGHEADDVLATAVERFAREHPIVLISRDKDLDQLLRPGVVLYDPMEDQTFDADAVFKKKGYRPDQAVEVQTLCGDSIDNIPGVPGVGPKTAAKLIEKYGTVENVLAHANEQTPKLRQNLLASAATLPITRRLVTLDRAVPLPLDLEATRFKGVPAAIRPIFAELGFNRLLDQLDAAGAPVMEATSPQRGRIAPSLFSLELSSPVSAVLSAPSEPSASPRLNSSGPPAATARDFHYSCIDTPEKLDAILHDLAGVKRLSVDTETTGTDPMRADLVGVSLAWREGQAVYLPVRGPMGARCLPLELLRDKLAPILGDETLPKIGQNIKYDMLILLRAGMPLRGLLFDTMVAAWVLDSNRAAYNLDALAMEFLNHRCIPIEDLIGRGKNQRTMDVVPCPDVAVYASEDADVALRLAGVLEKMLNAEGLEKLFHDLEMPLVPVLAEMERAGVLVDKKILDRLAIPLAAEADKLRQRILELAGHPFNPDSPAQLAVVMFDELKLKPPAPGGRMRNARSTDSSVLDELAITHDLPRLVLEYRSLQKLLGTYLKALGKCVNPATGRVHTSFRLTGTATGRLSSSDPNLQNIPIRTEQGRRIRSAFVAEPGSLLVSADYSQVELRVLAHLSGDETLRAAFASGQDIHRIVASEVFGVPLDSVTGDQRAKAKTVNFGIIYGQTAFGLATSLRIGRKEAGDFIADYKRRFPRIEEFLQECIANARRQGYVETIFRRRRKIAEIDSRNPQRKALAERLAINSVVQGSAADLIKQAMVNIDARIRREHRPSRMLLQIHDELLLEVPEAAVESEKAMIAEEMTGAIQLSVPLKVDMGVGPNWMEAK
jgi:DNA polymerase-1